MAIEDRNLSIGTKLWSKYKGQVYTAEVVLKEGATGNDAIAYKLADGREFKSPSAEGTAITRKACNGWAFWSVGDPTEGTGQVRTARAPRAAVTAVPKPERKTRRGGKTGATQGETAEPPTDEPSEPTDETQAEGIECGQCGVVLPNAEAAAAHFEDVHAA